MSRETLTREQIVAAAVELLDAEGLEGLNLRALGGRLSSAPTAMYWHVQSKDNLVVLAADSLWSEVVLPDPAEVGWRAAAMAMARDLRTMVTRHPWLATAMSTHLIYGPGKARHDDHALGVYEAAGFQGRDADWALETVFVYVLGHALSEAAELSRQRRLRREGGEKRDRQAIAEAIEIGRRFPRLRARAEPAAEGPDDSFDRGLELILDALESRLTS